MDGIQNETANSLPSLDPLTAARGRIASRRTRPTTLIRRINRQRGGKEAPCFGGRRRQRLEMQRRLLTAGGRHALEGGCGINSSSNSAEKAPFRSLPCPIKLGKRFLVVNYDHMVSTDVQMVP